jgi:hypothetical protein
VVLVARSRWAEGPLARIAPRQSAPLQAEYAFLLGRYIDSATLARANEIALRWGVHPHEVMIANGWLDAEDYYRALAQDCGAPFKAELPAADGAPAATATPRQSLATGLLKERDRARRFVFAPDRVRPNALREMLGRLAPHEFSLASPQAVRGAHAATSRRPSCCMRWKAWPRAGQPIARGRGRLDGSVLLSSSACSRCYVRSRWRRSKRYGP